MTMSLRSLGSQWRKSLRLNQHAAVFDSQRIVNVQNVDRCSTDRRLADERRAVPIKMVVPVVGARIEQADEFIGVGIVAGCEWPFGRIARRASEAEVVQYGRAVQFL